jgi:hypothetical protein
VSTRAVGKKWSSQITELRHFDEFLISDLLNSNIIDNIKLKETETDYTVGGETRNSKVVQTYRR